MVDFVDKTSAFVQSWILIFRQMKTHFMFFRPFLLPNSAVFSKHARAIFKKPINYNYFNHVIKFVDNFSVFKICRAHVFNVS